MASPLGCGAELALARAASRVTTKAVGYASLTWAGRLHWERPDAPGPRPQVARPAVRHGDCPVSLPHPKRVELGWQSVVSARLRVLRGGNAVVSVGPAHVVWLAATAALSVRTGRPVGDVPVRCRRSGRMIGGCPRCQRRRYYFSQAVALGSYHAELQQVVLRMKRPAFEPLTRTMGLYLAELVRDRLRRTGRGSDRADPHALVATAADGARILPSCWPRRWAQVMRLPVSTQLLRCRRKAKKQGTLRPTERFKNVRGTFCVSSGYDITDANVLIVDDIMTTGATASEAARVLRQAGARTVYVAVVARGGR